MGEIVINDSIKFSFTKDRSVGLYNEVVHDVYHSVFGAKTEAEEKFIKPLNLKKNFLQKKQIKVLDICYGIGYNTKAFLNEILNLKYNGLICIDALEYDKNLVLMSPFLKDGYFKTYPEISFLLFKSLADELLYSRDSFIDRTDYKSIEKYVAPFYKRFLEAYFYRGYVYIPDRQINAFLHNIYYHYISQRNKIGCRLLKNGYFTFNYYFDDARLTVKSMDNEYDIIFLDAFTPAKLPTLWSLDFIRELHRISSNDCLLVTYSNSAAVRHSMLEAGYAVGKIFDREGRASGTIASKNSSLILNKLNDYDTGLIKTSAGVYYRDNNLSKTADEILYEHEKRKLSLNLESTSRYIKKHKKEHKHA